MLLRVACSLCIDCCLLLLCVLLLCVLLFVDCWCVLFGACCCFLFVDACSVCFLLLSECCLLPLVLLLLFVVVGVWLRVSFRWLLQFVVVRLLLLLVVVCCVLCVLRVDRCLSCVVRWLPLFVVCLHMLFVVKVYYDVFVVRCSLLSVGCHVLSVFVWCCLLFVVLWFRCPSFVVDVCCCSLFFIDDGFVLFVARCLLWVGCRFVLSLLVVC